MYVEESGAAPAKADAICARGDLLVFEQATGLALPGTTVSGHWFLGFCTHGFDNTGGLDGVLTHNKQARTVDYSLGIYPVEPAVGVTPFPGMRCYLASATTFSGAPVGPFIGLAVKPSHESGIWLVDMRPAVGERGAEFQLQATIPDVSTADEVYIPAPRAGKIVLIEGALDAGITVAVATVSTNIAGTPVTGGDLVFPISTPAPNQVSASPTAANVFTAGQYISVATDGGSTSAARGNIVVTCQP